ncbi:hypothetical protein [Rubrivivax rivuli]|uniref:Uncharacterized protein n=1 Tax=Rubrivivax rivuli TaxID=1862385 RepID=A0A437RAJ2_9BURK|nr:hypothetical protein [Rubrivivax rivuli]RVU43826.1 hypothetical protein EOE66_19370 [Rubrivivax rivuli]
MSRLHQEFARLYLPAAPTAPGALAEATELAALAPSEDAFGQVRALVIEVARPAQWAPLSALWRGVQADFGWPAPAIAVNGVDGLQLWFSLAQPVPHGQAQACVAGLRRRYLAVLRDGQVAAWPPAATLAPPRWLSVPVLREASGAWSAFVAPDLAAIFEDTPWLDLPPGAEGQASLLARSGSIAPAQWQAAMASLAAEFSESPMHAAPPGLAPAAAAEGTATDRHSPAATQARAFLLRVMEDESLPWAQRIEAAKALLAAG